MFPKSAPSKAGADEFMDNIRGRLLYFNLRPNTAYPGFINRN